MRVVRKSRILDGVESLLSRLFIVFKSGFLLSSLTSLYPKIEFRVRSRQPSAWGRGLRDRLRRDVELSRIRRRLSALLSWITATSVGSIGTFLLLRSGFLAALLTAIHPSRPTLGALLGALVALGASILLLRVRQSLGYALRHSRIASALLFGFCGLSPFACTGGREGRERRRWALLGALFFTVLEIRFGTLRLLGVGFASVIFAVALAVPELSVVGVLLLLPFLEYLPHPTALLTAAVLFSDLAWLCKAVSGRRRLTLGTLDFAVLLFCLSFLL